VRTLLLIAGLATAGLSMAKAAPNHAPPALPGAAGVVRPETIPAKVRSAGLIPATLPKRVGSIYVMQAVDQRGKMFRVVAAADSGNILAVRPAAGRTGKGHERSGRKSVTARTASLAAPKIRSVPKAQARFQVASIASSSVSESALSGVANLIALDGVRVAQVPKDTPSDNKDAADDGLVLTLGRLSPNADGARQVLSLENKTATSFSAVGIECGFYANGRLVGSGYTAVADLAPGSLAHGEVVARHISDADDVKCRTIPRR